MNHWLEGSLSLRRRLFQTLNFAFIISSLKKFLTQVMWLSNRPRSFKCWHPSIIDRAHMRTEHIGLGLVSRIFGLGSAWPYRMGHTVWVVGMGLGLVNLPKTPQSSLFDCDFTFLWIITLNLMLYKLFKWLLSLFSNNNVSFELYFRVRCSEFLHPKAFRLKALGLTQTDRIWELS